MIFQYYNYCISEIVNIDLMNLRNSKELKRAN